MGRFSVTVLATMLLFVLFGCENDTKTEQIKDLVCNVTSTNVTTNGGSNGSITVTVVTGNGEYDYYNNNQLDANRDGKFENLIAGTYNIKVTDSKGKEFTKSVTITQPNQLTITITSQTNVTCYGRSTGSFTVTASGENGNYEYKIGNGQYQSSGTFSNLSVGTYTVTVKSGTVTTTKDITITQPNQLSLISSVTNPTTVGGNGQITLTASGGTLPYNYQLNSGVFQPSNVFNATAGTYTATVKDGCDDTKTINNIVVTNPVIAPTVSNLSASNITSTSVTINADVNTGGSSTNVYVKYGTSAGSLTNTSSTITLTNNTTVSINLTGLTPNTLYYYKVLASNGGGFVSSGLYSFTTSVPTYNIGDELYGGVIFYVDGTGQHGKIVQKTNEITDMTWYVAKNLNENRNGKIWKTPNWNDMKLIYDNVSNVTNPKITPLVGWYWTNETFSLDAGQGIVFDTNSPNNSYSGSKDYIKHVRLTTTF